MLELIRPRQWTKNLAVFAPLVFARHLFILPDLLRVAVAFCAFCLISGAAYILNDILDRNQDRLHPAKRFRPIASGRVAPRRAAGFAVVLAGIALAAGAAAGGGLASAVAGYLLLQVAYSAWLKHVPGVDVLALAAGFLVRVAAGGWVIGVEISPWILACTLNLAVFLGLAKRRHELFLLAGEAGGHRASLAHYTPRMLDRLLLFTAVTTVTAYGLYTVAEQTVRKFGSMHLAWTIPFVAAGVGRYLHLIHRRHLGGSPEWVLLTDGPLIAIVLLWFAAAAAIVYL